MVGDNDDLISFLQGFGFSEDELNAVMDELNSYRSIPGTTVSRFMNRVANTIKEEDRPAFLKGIMVGLEIKKAVDALSEQDLSDEELRIDREIERIKSGR